MVAEEGVMRSWRRLLLALMLLLGIALLGGQAVAGASGGQEFAPVTAHAQSGHDVVAQKPLDTPTGTCIPSWQVVTSPNFGDNTNYLQGVAAISTNDVWAVGTNDYGASYPGGATLTLHWDGQAWTRVPSPNIGTVYDLSGLLAVAAVSANDVWAVGYSQTSAPGSRTLIEHWDGNQWSIVPSPSIANSTQQLSSVSALSTNNVWAVGFYTYNSGQAGYWRTFTQHWDGTQWSIVPSPNVSTDHNSLWSVAALSTSSVWAVGYYITDNSLHEGDTLVEHWNGTQWSIVGSPNGSSTHNELVAISIISSTDIWAVGHSSALLEHWDGNQWSVVYNPSGGYLWGAASLSSTDVWAVGYYYSCQGRPCGYRTLTEHYSDPCAPSTFTPTPTASPTPSPTATPTLSPTATPTTVSMLVGHINWESRPPQPNALQQLPITLTLKLTTTEVDYPMQLTDQYGFFTITLGSLPNGTYNWRADDTSASQHSPNYLANTGTVNLTGAPITSVEMGLMRTGDANDDNIVNVSDFNMLKVSFGFGCGNPAYDSRADFTGDCLVNISDFPPLKRNFGQQGAPPIGP